MPPKSHNSIPVYDEKTIMERISRGDQLAFRLLFDHHRDRVYSFAFFLTRQDSFAEDLTQEIFTKVWLRRQELLQIDYFISWLKVVTRHEAYNYMRRQSRERLALKVIADKAEITPVYAPSAMESTEARELERIIQEAIDQLPPQQQKVYLLSRKEGLKQEYIADEMQLSVNTVKNHLKAALRSVRQYVDARIDTLVLVAIALFFHD